jgi:hypothetical protein
VEQEQQSLPQTVANEAIVLGRLALALPQRADRVLRLAERGELRVATPALNAQMRRVERSVSRMMLIVVFAALIVAGAVLIASSPVVGSTLMILSLLPLAMALLGGLGSGG